MAHSLKSFAKALGDDSRLREKYRSDPISALRGYDVEFTLDEFMDLSEVFLKLPGGNFDDTKAYGELLQWVAANI
jgi:hypothetical protein